jgi:RNA polymerase sigma factor (sigma-70 family)
VALKGIASVPTDRSPDFLDDESVRLFLAWQNGDERAFGRLYTLWRVRLLRWLTGMTRDAVWAEEVYQETWMTVIQHRKTYEPRARFGTWLLGVGRSRLIDSARRRGRQVSASAMDEAHLGLADEGGDTFDSALLNQYLDAYRRCLPALPDDQREAFLLRTQQELEWSEVAAITKASAETARSRFRYASSKLKGCMGL